MLQRLLAWLTGKKATTTETTGTKEVKGQPGVLTGRTSRGNAPTPGDRGPGKSKPNKTKRMKVKRNR